MNVFHALPTRVANRLSVRVLALAGSLRRDSCNLRLLDAAAACAPAGMTIDVYRELAAIPLFNEDLEHAGGPALEAVHRLRDAVARADGLLIATPEYNQSMPGVLKNVVDWLSRAAPDEVLAGKPVAVLGASSGRWGTRLAQHALRQTLFATEARVMPAPALYIRDAAGLFDDAGWLKDAGTQQSLQALLDAFAHWVGAFGSGQTRGAEEDACQLPG